MGYIDGLMYKIRKWGLDELSKLHTKTLLRELNSLRVNRDNLDNSEILAIDGYYKKIKEVLAMREHIPNKIEAKKIRQERAKKK